FPLILPPLRERARDIMPLARWLLARHLDAGRPEPQLATAAEAKLLSHRWPGTVRELDNLMQRALILADGGDIGPEHVQFELPDTPPSALPAPLPAADAARGGLSADLRSVEEQRIVDALRVGNGSRKHAAEVLGISPRTLRYKIARLREAGVALP
ncbi:MAG: helix-turn-helix domain-containing protein, partial [Gammaproteobacteria bacterium]